MGVIGMWTSAEHELSDPLGASSHTPTPSLPHSTLISVFVLVLLLGPFWAWKVGPSNDVGPTLSGRLQQQRPDWIGGTASTSTSTS
jgi:hypothetical protein